ncbi:transmembrane 9 superfamily protein [Elsinoe australis]|uniref:Transmembrane 9 superfamily member n=1 Tax=Elsinoe australis TaxID=40998 RepID=A0A4U7AU12_9PEZI|nr:transmembrane 9 superfamily protein [Elsinoe australis]
MEIRKLPPSLLLIFCASTLSSAFYLPGVAPTNYKTGDRVPLTVNHVSPSIEGRDPQVHSVFAYDYYLPSFHFCEPEGGPKSISESLGSILFGDRIQTSPFELKMGVNETCKHNCGPQVFTPNDAMFVNEIIRESFDLNWLIDGLPAAQPEYDGEEEIYSPGFALGGISEADQVVLNNHYDIFIDYHQSTKDTYRVVGVLVKPSSRGNNKLVGEKAECEDENSFMILSEEKDTQVQWTYSVFWRPSATSFATRWDKYLHVENPQIHWFFLILSAAVVVVLVAMVSTVLIRTLRKDIARYNRLDNINLDDLGGTSLHDDVQEDSGWKLIHGDVFRPPPHPLILSILVGNGSQLFLMTGFTLAFALLGFLSPSNRGSLTTVMILLYTIFSFASGYASSRTYSLLSGDAWKPLFVLTPTLLPATVFASFFLLNLFVWARASSGAVPFTTMLVLVAIWFLITLPLSFLGSWLGFRQQPPKNPTKTNQIPRQIPPSNSAYMRPIPSALLVAVLPFAAIWVELYFILSSFWSGRVYYMFGFLFLCFGLMIVTSACVTVLVTYFVLCGEDWRWQWRAFYTSGMSGLYVFLYALWWWGKGMSLASWTAGVVFVGYSAVVAGLWFVLTGTIGFIAAWGFVHRIYGSLKID